MTIGPRPPMDEQNEFEQDDLQNDDEQYDDDWSDDDDWGSQPPAIDEVCSRIFALAATLWRTQLEMHSQQNLSPNEVLREKFEELNLWMEHEQLEKKFSNAEKRLHLRPFGKWSESEVFELIWRFEALVVLLWAPIASVSVERHLASNWLSGFAPKNNWDKTRTDT